MSQKPSLPRLSPTYHVVARTYCKAYRALKCLTGLLKVGAPLTWLSTTFGLGVLSPRQTQV